MGSATPSGRGREQGAEQPRGVLLDAAQPVPGEDLGHHVGQRAPVLQDVGDARRAAQVVLQHPEGALVVADEVDPGDVDPHPVGRPDAVRLAVEVRGAGDELARDHLVAQDLPGPVDVGEEHLQGPDPLGDTGLDDLPLGGVDDPRDEVHRQRPLAARERERDALGAQVRVAQPRPAEQLVGPERLERPRQPLAAGADLAVGVVHLVPGQHGRIMDIALWPFHDVRLPTCYGCRPAGQRDRRGRADLAPLAASRHPSSCRSERPRRRQVGTQALPLRDLRPTDAYAGSA